MTFAKWLDVEKGKDLITLKEFEGWDFPLDDLAKDTGGHGRLGAQSLEVQLSQWWAVDQDVNASTARWRGREARSGRCASRQGRVGYFGCFHGPLFKTPYVFVLCCRSEEELRIQLIMNQAPR